MNESTPTIVTHVFDELKDRKLLSKNVAFVGVELDITFPKSFDWVDKVA